MPGGSTQVTLRLTPAAPLLPSQVYDATLWFTNQLTGGVQSRAITLLMDQPVIQNGGFETGDATGWQMSGFGANNLVVNRDAMNDGLPGTNFVHSGNHAMVFGAFGSRGNISQSLQTIPGCTYRLSFWLRNPRSGRPNEFMVQWNGKTLFYEKNLGAFDWRKMQFTLRATAPTTVLLFGARNDPYEFALDDVEAHLITQPPLDALASQPPQSAAAPTAVAAPDPGRANLPATTGIPDAASGPGAQLLAGSDPLILLRTSGQVRWSGPDALLVRQAPEVMRVSATAGIPEATFAAPATAASAGLWLDPGAGATGQRQDLLVLQNQAGWITLCAAQTGAVATGSATLLNLGADEVLTWDLLLLRHRAP